MRCRKAYTVLQLKWSSQIQLVMCTVFWRFQYAWILLYYLVYYCTLVALGFNTDSNMPVLYSAHKMASTSKQDVFLCCTEQFVSSKNHDQTLQDTFYSQPSPYPMERQLRFSRQRPTLACLTLASVSCLTLPLPLLQQLPNPYTSPCQSLSLCLPLAVCINSQMLMLLLTGIFYLVGT